MNNQLIINPVTWSASKTGVAPYVQMIDPNGSGLELPSWQPDVSKRESTQLLSNAELPPYVTDPTARNYYFTCQNYNAKEIASLTSSAVPGTIVVNDPGTPGSCSVSWKSVVSGIYTDHTQILAQPTCQEACPADGSAMMICPRPPL
jgi:hypothetical protein